MCVWKKQGKAAMSVWAERDTGVSSERMFGSCWPGRPTKGPVTLGSPLECWRCVPCLLALWGPSCRASPWTSGPKFYPDDIAGLFGPWGRNPLLINHGHPFLGLFESSPGDFSSPSCCWLAGPFPGPRRWCWSPSLRLWWKFFCSQHSAGINGKTWNTSLPHNLLRARISAAAELLQGKGCGPLPWRENRGQF